VSVLIIFSHIFVPIVVFIVSSRHHHRRVPAHEFQQLDDRQRERVLVPIAHESRQRLERIVRVVIASIVSGRASPHRSAQRRRDVRLVVVVVVPRPAPNDRGRRRRAASRAGVVVEVVRVVVELEQKLHLSATARPRDRATTARASGARVTPTHPKPSTRHSLNPRRARETRARARRFEPARTREGRDGGKRAENRAERVTK
jgi:hypothetical protein